MQGQKKKKALPTKLEADLASVAAGLSKEKRAKTAAKLEPHLKARLSGGSPERPGVTKLPGRDRANTNRSSATIANVNSDTRYNELATEHQAVIVA